MARIPGIFRERSPLATRTEQTFWNGEPTPARRVRATIAAAPGVPAYWARELVGEERDAVEVTYYGQVFYLDDQQHRAGTTDGAAWRKVTVGRGSPAYGHRNLEVEPGSVVDRP
jgi:hypothetical protein